MKRIKHIEDGVRLRVQHEDDLWALAQMIRPGCRVGMMGFRRDQSTGTQEAGRAKSADRKPMWIVLNAESTEFQPFTDNLRIHGIISEAAMDKEIPSSLGLQRACVAVTNTRDICKTNMQVNAALPSIHVDPQTYEVFADGDLLTCQPAETLPMAQRYLLL